MNRLLKGALSGLLVCGLIAVVSFTGCKSKAPAPAPAKAAEPTKAAATPAKPDPKAAAASKAAADKAAEKAKLAKAEAAFKDAEKKADAALDKKPRDYDGAIKAYADAKATVAGTAYDKKCADEIADLTKARDKAAAEAKTAAEKAAAASKTAADEAADKAKLAKAEATFKDAEKKADAALDKKPKDYDGAIKAYTDAKATVAGTAYDKKCADEIADLTKARDKAMTEAKAAADKAAAGAKVAADKAAAKDKLVKAKAAFKDAEKKADAALDKKPKDYDGAIKAYADAKAMVAGTAYDKDCADEIAALTKARDKALAAAKVAADKAAAKPPVAKVEPKPAAPAVKPITDQLATPAGDVKSAEEAWKKAEELEKVSGKDERAGLSAALPYYLFVVTARDAEGRFDINAPEAALRIARTVEKYADDAGERLAAAKFYMVSASLNPGSDVWERAEKPYVKAGKGATFAALLKSLSNNASARAAELSGSADPQDNAQAEALKKFSASVGKRADALSAKYAAGKS